MVQQGEATGCNPQKSEVSAQKESPEKPGFNRLHVSTRSRCLKDRGLEPMQSFTGKREVDIQSGAESGAVCARNDLLEAWLDDCPIPLGDAQRVAVRATVEGVGT